MTDQTAAGLFALKDRRTHLNERVLATMKPGERIWDDTVRQLYAQRLFDRGESDPPKSKWSFRVLVEPSSKIRKSIGGPKTRERTIGHHRMVDGRHEDLSCKQARDKARDAISQLMRATSSTELISSGSTTDPRFVPMTLPNSPPANTK